MSLDSHELVETQSTLQDRYAMVRDASVHLCDSLHREDYTVQSMTDASPVKWHLAHTSWFFETFLLAEHVENFEPYHPQFGYLFNSYYNAVGQRHPRPQRGLLTRPTVEEVFEYRQYVDRQMLQLLEANESDEIARLVEIGLQHEQQHQELLLTDVKHLFSCNPLRPAYVEHLDSPTNGKSLKQLRSSQWTRIESGLSQIGHDGIGFAFDNESPRHTAYLHDAEIANRLVTNGEYLEFIESGGYQKPDCWLSAGWDVCQQAEWQAPLYWENRDGQWWHFTLTGMQPVDWGEPVCHVSFYEADAFARWSDGRLPTEFEWESVAADADIDGNFVEQQLFRPTTPDENGNGQGPLQLYGDVWEWTSSPYVAYPGYSAPDGALGEYNGKFMSNQMVLRGGSCATPISHIRPTYRNFFAPHLRWQFAGIRLARDV